MRVSAATVATLATLVVAQAQAQAADYSAADIDVEFLQDGRTTYCDGVHEDEGALVFEELKVTSAGKCPVVVEIKAAQTTLPTVGSPLAVTWSASLDMTVDVATSLFPRVVDAATGKPKNVIASMLVACVAGTNCADASQVVVPAGSGSAEEGVGEFDASGKKELRVYTFQFPTEGQYVIVGKVVLPGDAALNISATEFVSFKTVQVGVTTGSTDAPGTVKPAERHGLGAGSPSSSDADVNLAPVRTTEAPNIDVQAEAAEQGALQARSGDKNLLLLGVVAGVGAIGVVAAFAISRRQSRGGHDLGFHDDTMKTGGSIYRLDNAPPHSAVPAPQPPQGATSTSQRRPPKTQLRYYEQEALPSSQTGPVYTTAAHRALGLSEEEIKFDDSEDGSVAGDPFTQSQVFLLNSLHDSTARMPRRGIQPSTTASSVYSDSLSGLSEDGEPDRGLSDIHLLDHGLDQSNVTLAPLRPIEMRDLSEYDAHGLDQSTYSWVYSQSEADLSSFHMPPRGTQI